MLLWSAPKKLQNGLVEQLNNLPDSLQEYYQQNPSERVSRNNCAGEEKATS